MSKLVQIRLDTADPFQARLETALKTLGHGRKGSFLVNLLRMLFGHMATDEMREAMIALSYSSAEHASTVFSEALARTGASQVFAERSAPVVKPEPVPEPKTKEAPVKAPPARPDFTWLSIQD